MSKTRLLLRFSTVKDFSDGSSLLHDTAATTVCFVVSSSGTVLLVLAADDDSSFVRSTLLVVPRVDVPMARYY
jgi:hypothetical protein